jgi:hypothetical protein
MSRPRSMFGAAVAVVALAVPAALASPVPGAVRTQQGGAPKGAGLPYENARLPAPGSGTEQGVVRA